MQKFYVLKDYMGDICGIFSSYEYLTAAKDRYLAVPDDPERKYWTRRWGYSREPETFVVDLLYYMYQNNDDIYRVVFDYETLRPIRAIKMTPTPRLGTYIRSSVSESAEVVVAYGVWSTGEAEAVETAKSMVKVDGIKYGMRMYHG